MLKKLLTLFLLLSSLSMAIELKLMEYPKYVNGASNIEIIFKNYEEYKAKKNSTDWIAVYKKGTSTEWENVLTWAWVKDLDYSNNNGFYYAHKFSDTHFTEAGEYEIRYLANNSYDIEESINFTIKKVESHLIGLYASSYNFSRQQIWLSGFDGKNIIPDEKDWVGIYTMNDDNTWENVIQWAWAKDLKDDLEESNYLLKLDLDKLQEGVQYEARYFLNNSFTTYKKSQPFYAGELPVDEQERITCIRVINNDNKTNKLFACPTPDFRSEASKTWVGVFQKDIKSKNHDNLIAWTYLDKENHFNIQELEILKPELLIDGQEYQTVYFTDDSYKQEGKAYTFMLKNFN